MREKKLGLFGNAKYSRPVFKNVSEAVAKGVEKDIARLVRHESSQEIRKWGNVPSQPSTSLSQASFARNINNHNNHAPTMRPPHFRRSYANDAGIALELPSQQQQDVNLVLQDFSVGELSAAKKKRVESPRRVMPTSPPLESIAKNILRSCPKISLRESDAVEYGDEVFLLAKRVLQTQINKTFTTSAVDGGNANNKTSKKSGDKANSVLSDFELSRRSTSNEMEVFRDIRDKTAVFDDDSDDFDELDALDSESPTRCFSFDYVDKGETQNTQMFINTPLFKSNNASPVENDGHFLSPESYLDVENVENSTFLRPPTFADNSRSVSFNFGDPVDFGSTFLGDECCYPPEKLSPPKSLSFNFGNSAKAIPSDSTLLRR